LEGGTGDFVFPVFSHVGVRRVVFRAAPTSYEASDRRAGVSGADVEVQAPNIIGETSIQDDT
jgi:hypothetical protein